jgi:superfamily II DNA or RNA helicase
MDTQTAVDFLRLSVLGGIRPPIGPIPFDPYHIRKRALRDYQEKMILEAISYMRLGVRRILLQLPTGGGKTVMAAAMHGSAMDLGLTSEFIVHRKELVDQTSRTFTQFGIPHGFIAAGHPLLRDELVSIAGVGTLVNRLEQMLPPNLATVDEAHHATAASWQRLLDEYGEAFVIGLTATPERLDGKGLDDQFDVMIKGPPVAELIRRGYLSDFDYYAPGQPDLTGIHTTAGDFNRGEIAELMDKPKLIGDVIEHYLRLAEGQPGIVFAASREHSRHMADAFLSHGIRAAHVDGAMPDRERDRVVAAFRAGDIRVMTNVDLFGEGFDVPGIVYCGLARPTKSLSLFMQQCGRALRMFDGKPNAILADHAGNVLRHGLPDDEREWSLKGRVVRQRSAGENDALPVRQCKVCFRVSPSTATQCPGCGEQFPVQVRKLEQEDGQLTKVEREALRRQRAIDRKIEERACESPDDFIALAKARGYANPRGWAKVQWKLRKGGKIR